MTQDEMLDGLKAGRTLYQDGGATEQERRDVEELVRQGVVTRELEVVDKQYSRHVIRIKPREAFYEWHPIETIEPVYYEGLIDGSDTVMLWNPCDGHHLAWLLTERAHNIAAQGREGIYTLWCLPKAPPAAPRPRLPT